MGGIECVLKLSLDTPGVQGTLQDTTVPKSVGFYTKKRLLFNRHLNPRCILGGQNQQ